jgi:hypothetical protein
VGDLEALCQTCPLRAIAQPLECVDEGVGTLCLVGKREGGGEGVGAEDYLEGWDAE